MAPQAYQFRPMAPADLPLVRRWLEMPHVSQWWGDAREQFMLIKGDFDHPAMDQFIVATDGRPTCNATTPPSGRRPAAAINLPALAGSISSSGNGI